MYPPSENQFWAAVGSAVLLIVILVSIAYVIGGRMTMGHEQKVENAKKAVDAVFSDTTVGQAKTRDSLEELAGHIDDMLDTLEEDD